MVNGSYDSNPDADHFDFRCLGCFEAEKNSSGYKPNPGGSNDKYIKCAGCPKPAKLRRGDGSLIVPYKGKNGEELCHKCALCAKCGKEACGESFNKYEKTNDNPSGS